MNLIPPDGLVGRLRFEPRHHVEFESYGHLSSDPRPPRRSARRSATGGANARGDPTAVS